MGVPRSKSPARANALQKKAVKPANGKKAATKQETAKKAPTKKTAAEKKAPTKTAAEKKNPAKKTAAEKKNPAKKSTVKTTSVKKATDKKTPTKKNTPAKKTTSKKTSTKQEKKESLAKNTKKKTTPKKMKDEKFNNRKRGRPLAEDEVEPKQKRVKVVHDTHLHEQGVVLALGEGDTGQLGLGPDVMERTNPGKVDLPDDVVQISAGGMHTVCLTKHGEVYTWGCNDEGALGRKTQDEDECMEPGKVDIPEGHKIVQISAGDSHSVALTEDGAVYAWGTFRDASGSIGLTINGKSETPVEMAPELNVCRIASGSDHVACVTTNGHLYTLGNGEQGQLGRVAECFSNRGGRKGLGFLLKPGEVHTTKRSTKFDNVWTGAYVTYAHTTTGEVYSWGLNNYFQLGFDDMKNRYVPECAKSFDSKKHWKELAGGQHHTIALDSEGVVYSLGRKEYGRLGLGENVDEKAAPTPIKTLEGKKCVNVACGTAVSMAVTEDGEVYAWGMGTSKQLGNAEEEDLWEPTCITGKQLQNRRSLLVTSGGQHTIILAQDK